MKKLLLLLSFPLMAFNCDPETVSMQQMECNCIQDNFFDSGYEMVIQPSTTVDMQLCDESESEAVIHIKGTPYWYALRVECN